MMSFFLIGKTDEELSLVCRTEFTPDGCIDRENGWRGFRFSGKIGFSEIGILARVSGILALKPDWNIRSIDLQH